MVEKSGKFIPQLSIVIPVIDETCNIGRLVDKIDKAIADQFTYEIVMVEDSSSESTTAEIRRLFETRETVRVVFHTRDFGQNAATRTGVTMANAPVIAVLDRNFEYDSASLSNLCDRLNTSGDIRMLVDQLIRRRGGWQNRLSSRVADFIRASR